MLLLACPCSTTSWNCSAPSPLILKSSILTNIHPNNQKNVRCRYQVRVLAPCRYRYGELFCTYITHYISCFALSCFSQRCTPRTPPHNCPAAELALCSGLVVRVGFVELPTWLRDLLRNNGVSAQYIWRQYSPAHHKKCPVVRL